MEPDLIAIEIGGTKTQIVRGDASGVVRERRRFEVNPGRGAQGIRDQIQSALHELSRQGRVRAIGVGYGGPVDWRTGRVCCSHQVEGWSDFPLGDWLSEEVGRPVAVDNDANVAALGEAHFGAGRGLNPVFYTTLGSGVGGGLVVDGGIYHGIAPGEVEIGHVRLDRDGTTVESRCAGWAVDRKVRAAIAADPGGILVHLAEESRGSEARWLGQALAAGDPFAHRILTETAADLGFGLSHVTHLIHPAVIVLGGGLALLGESLRVAVVHALSPFLMSAVRPGPQIALAGLREDAVPAGALLLADRLASGQSLD